MTLAVRVPDYEVNKRFCRIGTTRVATCTAIL